MHIKSKSWNRLIAQNIWVLIILLSFNFSSLAQGFNPDVLSLTVKAGLYDNINAKAGGARGYELNLMKNKLSYSMDYLLIQELVFSKSVEEKYEQIGFMIGGFTDFKQDKVRYSYQAGLSALWGNERGELISRTPIYYYEDPGNHRNYYSHYESKNFTTVGMLLKLEAQYMFTRYVSFGVSLATNISPKKVMYFPMFNLQIGKIRGKYREKKRKD